MGDVTWTALGTESEIHATAALDGKTDGSVVYPTSGFDNETDLNLLCALECALGSINPSGQPYITLALSHSIDGGTNYPDEPSTYILSGLPRVDLGITTGSSAKRVTAHGIILPPGFTKIVFQNNTGVTLATGGNSVKLRPYTRTIA